MALSNAEKQRRYRARQGSNLIAIRGDIRLETIAALIDLGELAEAEAVYAPEQ